MKSKYLMIGAAACAALFLFSGFMLYRQYADEKQSAEAFQNISALVEDETSPADELQAAAVPEQTAFENVSVSTAEESTDAEDTENGTASEEAQDDMQDDTQG